MARVLPGLSRYALTCPDRRDEKPTRAEGLPWRVVTERGGSVSFGRLLSVCQNAVRMRRRAKRKANAEGTEERGGSLKDQERFGASSQMRSKIIVGLALGFAIAALVTTAFLRAEGRPTGSTVKIEVHADHNQGAWHSIWNFWGYDEPNYT